MHGRLCVRVVGVCVCVCVWGGGGGGVPQWVFLEENIINFEQPNTKKYTTNYSQSTHTTFWPISMRH